MISPAIRDRDYRRLFAGAAFHQQGMSGEQVVLGFLVFEYADSTAWVGITLAVYFVPFFVFGLLSGAVADWIDRRTLLRNLELAMVATLALFAVALSMGPPDLWIIVCFSLCLGSLRALHQPARASYAYDLVGEANVVSAIGLLNLGSRGGQLVGALIAGEAMQRYGAPFTLSCLAGGHAMAYLAFRSLRAAGIEAVLERAPIGQNLREYATELRANRLLLSLLAITASVEIFGFSFATALPELAAGRLDIGADGLGALQATRAGAGILAGLIFAIYGTRNRSGTLYLGIILTFGLAMILLSQPSLLLMTFGAVFLVSLCAASCDILAQSMMQLSVANELRGRAMGIWVLALGFGPIGHLELGAVSDALGLSSGLLVNGLALVAIAAVAAVAIPRIRTF